MFIPVLIGADSLYKVMHICYDMHQAMYVCVCVGMCVCVCI